MSDPAAAVVTALDARLRADADLAAACGGVLRLYTAAPQNAALPLILIGDDDFQGDDDSCSEATDCELTVHVWARGDPPAGHASALSARQIGGAIRAALKDDLIIDGHDTDDWRFLSATYVPQDDGSVHGLLKWQLLVTATS